MTTCPRCGKPISAWTRNLSSGLCSECVQTKAKQDAEDRARTEAQTEAQRQEVAKSIERLQKLHAEGALTDEEFQQLETVRKSTAVPGAAAAIFGQEDPGRHRSANHSRRRRGPRL